MKNRNSRFDAQYKSNKEQEISNSQYNQYVNNIPVNLTLAWLGLITLPLLLVVLTLQ